MLCLLITIGSARAAVTMNQIETFSGVHDWTSGNPNPNPPVIQTDSGPLGAGDSALRVTANGGTGAGGRLLVMNETAWTGDYQGQGIVSLAMSLRNGGGTALSMRVAFNGPGGWFVTPATPVAAFSGWNSLLFDIKPSSLVSAGGSNAASTLSAVTELRVIHAPTVDFRGARLSSSFLVDNIHAVPEPEAALLAALAGGMLWKRRMKTTESAFA